MTSRNNSVWMATPVPKYPTLDRDLDVDVVIVGGGLTGITTAYLLRQEGVRVALIERDRLAAGDTGRTTAHLSYVTDYRLHHLTKHFGKDGARAFWEAGDAAIDEIERLVAASEVDCDFKRVPGFLHMPVKDPDDKERKRLDEDLALAQEFGFEASAVESVPYAHRYGIRFENQAKFHPRKYLAALSSGIPGEGSYIFENTEFEEVQDKPLAVRANGKTLRCSYLVIATHNPLMGKKGLVSATLFQTKLALYTSYVLGARLPKGSVAEALFWDTNDPYDYLRIDSHEDHDYAIFGGCDVKTGQEHDAAAVYQHLEQRLLAALPHAQVVNRWMGQVVETDDGLPFIGENAQQEFIATGFCGNGFTLGTMSALMARDRYLKRKNPWFDLFEVNRRPFHGGLWRYVKENLDYPYYLVRDRFAPAQTDSLDDLKRGEGKIIKLNGHKVAAYKNSHDKVTLCSAICTHMKCLVRWNAADKTWDCPCHGSRFHPTGEVLSGPAEEALEKISQ